jgi:hypothetical protein
MPRPGPNVQWFRLGAVLTRRRRPGGWTRGHDGAGESTVDAAPV